MMDDSCLYLDWLFTVLVTVFSVVVYVVPLERYHPMVVAVLAWSFFCWPLQFFFLEYGVAPLQSSGHADLVLLLIPLMAVFVVMILWCLRCLIVLVLTALVALMISQTQLIDISIPVAVVIGFMIALMVWFSSISNIVQAFAIAVYTSGLVTFGIASMILETSSATDQLPDTCSGHFNMWLTCDVNCGSITVYDQTTTRIGWGAAFLILFALRLINQWIFTEAFYRKPKLKSSCCCCDLLKYNADSWISLKDRKREIENDDEDAKLI